jgi:hypothetical protein
VKKLIPIEERISQLRKFGANKNFVKNIGNIEELEFSVEKVDSAYFYLPTIANYSILQGLQIIPIYNECDSFYVFGYNDTVQKIFYFELENDEIYKDYGTNWNLLLLDILFQYFEDEIERDLTIETFQKVGDKLGFQKSETLYKLLDIPVELYNVKYEELDKWKREIAETLGIM